MLLMRYLHLAILAATAATAYSQSAPEASGNDMSRQLAGDFDWDIQPEDGYPSIAFDDTNEDSEVIFKYNFTGTLTARKFLDVKLYKNDCVTAADASLAFINTTSGDELDVELDIIQETITDSIHYQDLNGTAAIIGFCLRVDYNYVDSDGATESINFYETNVTITVDLTANFTLTEISADRTLADSEAANADLAYPVEAYICLDDNSEVTNPAALAQGSFLQVCVRIDENVVTENILVEDILTFVVLSRRYTLPTQDHHQRRRRPDRQGLSREWYLQRQDSSVKFFTDISGRPRVRRCCHHLLLEGLPHAELCSAALLEDVVFVLFRSAALSPATTSKPLWPPRRRRIPTMKSR
jgi:hypothetical protein